MKDNIVSSGNIGDSIRSDCFVTVSSSQNKSVDIVLKSKVEKLFGNSINALCQEIVQFFDVNHIKIEIEDSGALPFVIAARLESALNRFLGVEKQFLFSLIRENQYKTARDKNRRTRLYLPGNTPKLMINAGIYGSDAVILDLEDSVAPEKKHEARCLVRNALCQVDFYGAERMVRINQIPEGINDLKYIVPFNVNVILIPKCENASQVKQVEEEIIKIAGSGDHGIFLMPVIESALGVENAFSIAKASESIVAMAIGLEDYTADVGVQRTDDGDESFFARSRIINAAVAAGIQPIDSVFSEFENTELLSRVAKNRKRLVLPEWGVFIRLR